MALSEHAEFILTGNIIFSAIPVDLSHNKLENILISLQSDHIILDKGLVKHKKE